MAFPNEILLDIIPALPLASLIAAHGVDHNWRRLVAAANVLAPRRELLDLYLTVVNSPWFLQTRPWVLENLQPFDREAYVAALLTQYNPLPEAFELWLLEWPARAVIGGIWPGLPWDHIKDGDLDNVNALRGVNWLAPTTVQVSAITFAIPGCKHQFDFIPAILIRSNFGNIWLIVDDGEDEREKGTLKFRNKVFSMDARTYHLCDETGNFDPSCDVVDKDWIAFQRRIWDEVGERVSSGRRLCSMRNNYWRSKPRVDTIGAPSWSTRCESHVPWCMSAFSVISQGLMATYSSGLA